jgi:hypothetical protein
LHDLIRAPDAMLRDDRELRISARSVANVLATEPDLSPATRHELMSTRAG